MEHADVLVVGLGALGSATTYQLAARGADVIGLDCFSPPHQWGSSHGDTRISREAIGEGMQYVPLAVRSNQLWRLIEPESGEDLFTVCGGLILAPPAGGVVDDFLSRTIAAAQSFDITHEVLGADAIRRRFPQFTVDDGQRGYYEPGAGFVRPERAVRAQLALAERHGARLHRNVCALDLRAGAEGVRASTSAGVFAADELVLAAGPWNARMLRGLGCGDIASLFGVYRQVQHWFEFSGPIAAFEPAQMPVFIWEFGSRDEDMVYGFPALDGQSGGVKVATEKFHTQADPDGVDRHVTEDESLAVFNKCLRARLLGLVPRVVKTAACLYTATPDKHFIVDRLPEHANVVLVSACSGRGFKHSAAVGESVAQLITDGKSAIDLSAFALSRFAG